MLQWLSRGSWVNTGLWLASLPICSGQGQAPWSPYPVRLPDRWGCLLSEWGRCLPCHLVAIATVWLAVSCKEWNNRAVSCITNSPSGFGWEELLSFHVLMFSQFFFVFVLLQPVCLPVCLSHSLFASSVIPLCAFLLSKLTSMNSPPLAVPVNATQLVGRWPGRCQCVAFVSWFWFSLKKNQPFCDFQWVQRHFYDISGRHGRPEEAVNKLPYHRIHSYPIVLLISTVKQRFKQMNFKGTDNSGDFLVTSSLLITKESLNAQHSDHFTVSSTEDVSYHFQAAPVQCLHAQSFALTVASKLPAISLLDEIMSTMSIGSQMHCCRMTNCGKSATN